MSNKERLEELVGKTDELVEKSSIDLGDTIVEEEFCGILLPIMQEVYKRTEKFIEDNS